MDTGPLPCGASHVRGSAGAKWSRRRRPGRGVARARPSVPLGRAGTQASRCGEKPGQDGWSLSRHPCSGGPAPGAQPTGPRGPGRAADHAHHGVRWTARSTRALSNAEKRTRQKVRLEHGQQGERDPQDAMGALLVLLESCEPALERSQPLVPAHSHRDRTRVQLQPAGGMPSRVAMVGS